MVVTFCAGGVLALGMMYAGIMRPSKVLGTLAIGKNWDGQVLVSYGFALIFTLVIYRVFSFSAGSSGKRSSRDLYIGAAILGSGIGLSGLDIGPSLIYFFISSYGIFFVISSVFG